MSPGARLGRCLLGLLVLLAACTVDIGKLHAPTRDAARDVPVPTSEGGPEVVLSAPDAMEAEFTPDVAYSAGDADEVAPPRDASPDEGAVTDLPRGSEVQLSEAGGAEVVGVEVMDGAADEATDMEVPVGAGGETGAGGAVGSGGMTETGGVVGTGGAVDTGGVTGAGGASPIDGATATGGTLGAGGDMGTGGAITVNLALSGTAYRWSSNTSAAANANRYAAPLLNDDSVAAEVNLNGTGDEYTSNAWEAAGVVLGQTATVTQIEFVNGSTQSGTYAAAGYFMANFRLQISSDGTTWADAVGWTLTPTYPYSSSAGDQTYAFTGRSSGALGVRVVGQVATSLYSGSAHVMAREVRVWGTAGGTSAGAQAFEAENLSFTASFVGASLSTEDCPTGSCTYVQLNTGASIGDWVELTIPSLAAGTYALTMYYKSNYNRGIARISVDGTTLALTCDEYASAAAFQVACNPGNATLAASGSHRIRFTVSGRNAASSGYMVTVDSLVFRPN